MKKKKAYITPQIRIILVETQGVMADFVSKSKTDDKTGNPQPPTIPTDTGTGGSSNLGDDGKFNSGSLWDFDGE